MKPEGPWYRLSEAASQLAIGLTDLCYKIEQQEIKPILYSSKRKKFMVLSRDPKGRRVGHACYKYKGPLEITKKLAEQIIKEKTGPLYGYYFPLDLSRIESFNNEYPFSKMLPNTSFSAWNPTSFDVSFSEKLGSALLPAEIKDLATMLTIFSDTIAKKTTSKGMSVFDEVPYVYLWCSQEDWNINDLRIPKSEITRISSTQNKLDSNILIDSKKTYTGSTSNMFYELIDRILQDNLTVSIHDFMSLIKNEHDGKSDENNQYDIYNTIQQADLNSIEYKGVSGSIIPISREAIATAISKRRKRTKSS